MKLYIVANRLPVKAVPRQDSYTFVRSEGGLATGLDSLQISMEKHWIGWPGVCVDNARQQIEIRQHLETMDFHPIFLSEEQYHDYYEGYSNSTIWPLCHYFFSHTTVRKEYWESYQKVNALFCEEICKQVGSGDWVWIQDYQLMLLPGMLRKRMPNLHIGYFHHIPFPSYELFRILPERAELLNGLMGADFIGFHTHDYMRYFINAVERVLHIKFDLDEAQTDSRIVRVNALPMGINYELYNHSSATPKVWSEIEKKRILFRNHKLLLSVDRLDYSKGILHRLQGFETFLERHPEYQGKVTLAMVIVPSRDHVESYAGLKTKIDETIGRINGRYSDINWTPVCYFYHGFSFEELTAMYFVADVALVTPLRDGMNLVAKEYVATKVNNPGVLVLSEMAGAAVELADAIQINPNDTDQIADAIYTALQMPYDEQAKRISKMQAILSVQTVNKWAADFMEEWKNVVDKNQYLSGKLLSTNLLKQIKALYTQARSRLILLDYDGTLVGFQKRPEDAVPTPEVIQVLKDLTSDPANHVVINSGRDHQTLEKWLGGLPISFAAEHGAYYKENGEWHQISYKPEWSQSILSILNMFVHKTPKSRLEIKETALAWHYRAVDSWLGELRARQLVRALVSICLQHRLQILQGNKVVEIKQSNCTKGSEVKRLLRKAHYDFILAMGDDTTDNDMFRALPESAVTVKIGTVSEDARYNLKSQTDALPMLQALATGAPLRISSNGKQGRQDLGVILHWMKKLIKRK